MAWQGWPRGTRVHTQSDVFALITAQRALNYPVGAHYSYTNSGFLLLRTLVERVAGQSFSDFTRTRIFEPLGMRATQQLNSYDDVIVDRALAYERRAGGYRHDLPRWLQLGDGAVFTTVEDLLRWAVAARSNVLVSGGTGAGKTTLLNALGACLPATARIVTVEETAELRLPHDHVVRLEARPASADGAGAVGLRELVRNALRMRPDRILVGEVRGAEALEMLWAMNTGHEGSLSTCHANSPLDALRRLEVMVLTAGLDLPLAAVRDQITSPVDLVVQVARLADGRRQVVAVSEVLDPPASGHRTRPLAGPDGLHALPERPARAGDAPLPSPGWCR